MARKKRKFSSSHSPDLTLLGAVLILLAFGVVMVYDASVVESLNLVGGQYHYLIRQAVWVAVGLAAAALFYRIGYRRMKALSLPLFALAALLLIFVLIPTPLSSQIGGSRSWISLPFEVPVLGDLRVQPSELGKLALILFLASLFTKGKQPVGEKNRPRFRDFFIPTAVICGLVALERDVGTLIVTGFLGVATFFFAGGTLLNILLVVPFLAGGGLFFWLTSTTFQNRVKVWLDAGIDPLGLGYQLQQIAIALGSGGLTGVGVGESKQKYGYIPEVTTDAIFAVVGEETGFVGSLAIIFLFALVTYRGLLIARHAPDDFSRIAAASITAWFGLQTLINLAALTRIIPWTGITLPLISYGGSSLVVMLSAFGILLNISKHTLKRR